TRIADTFYAHTTDGSYIDYQAQFSGPTLLSAQVWYRNGTEIRYNAPGGGALYPTSIVDANGNRLLIAYVNGWGRKIDSIQDAHGCVITFHYDYRDSIPLLTAVEGPGLAGGRRTIVRLHYRQLPLDYRFDATLTSSVRWTSAPWVIDAIYYPGTQTGYWFGDPDSYSSYGMLTKVIEQRDMRFS